MRKHLRLTKHSLLLCTVLVFLFATTGTAQNAVLVGSQVTSESNIVSGNYYILKTGAGSYITDNGTNYDVPNSANSATEASVYYLISNGDGTYKIKNVYTGNYWGVPVYNAAIPSEASESSAGAWSLNFSSSVAYPSAPDANSTTRGIDRSNQKLWGWSTGTNNNAKVYIYEVPLSSSALDELNTYNSMNISSTAADDVTTGQWYTMYDRGSGHGYLYENTSTHTLYNTATAPSGAPTESAKYLVRLVSGTDGMYYIQNGLGNYFGVFTESTAVPTTSIYQELITVEKIASTDGHFYLQSNTGGVILDANAISSTDPSTVVGWGTTVPTTTGGNNDWAFYPVELLLTPTASEVYTINNTNSSRGAMTYDPTNSTTYVWSSGKTNATAFDASSANCQWVIYPTGTSDQYYLYNVGADKFAIPSSTTSTASWIFSNDAVAVTLIRQSDGTYKIKTANTDTYAAVSNGYAGPIINYNDTGGNFTITLVSGQDQSTAVNAAVARLVDNQTPLSAIPASGTSDWYVIRIKTHATYADKYIYPASSEINYSSTNYPLTFDHETNVRPAIDNAYYYTRIYNESNMVYWQMPNGKYLYGSNNKFPISTAERTTFYMDYTSGSGIRLWGSNRYAVPYLLDNLYFIGETATATNAYYDLYPIDLATAGLTAWQVSMFFGDTDAQLTCSRSDVSGLTSVYNNGYFFLPTGTTPSSSDFTTSSSSTITVDATNYTINVVYPITASDVFTINNTNTSRGALIYNPDADATHVWSSGKSGTFDASNANSQWVIYPTGTSDQYYLYNVGAGKFVVNTGVGTGAENPWMFSDNAAPVTLTYQSTGTYAGMYKIQAANGRASDGTNNAIMAVSNGQSYPIINYDDAGSYFVITKVSGVDASTAATAAYNKLVENQTALTSYPTTSGWYAMQLRTSATANFVGRFVKTAASEYTYSGTDYPLTFTGPIDIHPAITDATYFTYIDVTNGYSNALWQMPNGKYLVNSGSKFPLSSNTSSTVIAGYDNGNYMKGGSYYAVSYNSGQNYFIGESGYAKRFYIYPIDLTTAGLQDWKVLVQSSGTPIYDRLVTCTRSDVSGLTQVYTNGSFFLPAGVTPESTDFTIEHAQSITVDASEHTVTVTFDPNIAISADDVAVAQGHQTTGIGNTMQPLLRIKATPFYEFQPTQFSISLSGAAQVDNVKVYSTTVDQINFSGVTPTLLGTVATPSDGTIDIPVTASSVAADATIYYWITADVKSNATEWETIDASLSSISYTNTYKTTNSLAATTLDLSAIGNPDGVMRIYKSKSVLWTSSNSETQYYRIPALLKTGTNTLLAFTDDRFASKADLGGNHKIDVLVRKSTDGGATWGSPVTVAAGDGSTAAGYGYGDAAVAQAANGDIVCLMAAGNTSYSGGMLHIGYTKSTDGGDTWSAVSDIYSSVSNKPDGIASTFVSSGHGLTMSNGTIAFPALGKIGSTTNEYVFYSQDNGTTWSYSTNYGYTGADESKLEELNDGTLLMSIRTGGFNSTGTPRGYNRTTVAASVDDWGTQGTWSDLTANGCNADLLYYSRNSGSGTHDVLLHTVVKASKSHNGSYKRYDLRLYMSVDQGATWHEAFQLQPGWAAYSSMQVLDNGDLAILFEDGSIGNEDLQDCYDISYVVISKELLESKLDEIIEDVVSQEVKVVYNMNGETTYGSLSGDTWTSNATSGMAGVTMTKSDGTFNKYSDWNSHYNLAYMPAAANTPSTLTLTAPAGYVITGYSLLTAKYSSSTHTYTLVAEDGTTITPTFASSSSGYTSLEVSGLSAASTAITITTDDNSYYLAIADFTISLSRSVTYHLLDAEGTEVQSAGVVLETLDADVDDEMPDAFRSAGVGYVYAFYSDAACTTSISQIAGSTTDIYVTKTFSTNAVVSGNQYTLRDDRSNRYVAMTGSGYVKSSDYLHPDCAWTFVNRGDDTFDLIANDGTYLSPETENMNSSYVVKTSSTQPSTGWTLSRSASSDGYWLVTNDNTSLHNRPSDAYFISIDRSDLVGTQYSFANNTNVISYGSVAEDFTGCRFLIEETPDMFQVSTDGDEHWYTFTTHRDNTDYNMQIGDVGKAVYGNSTLQANNMAQQWMITRRNEGGFNIVSRQDRSMFDNSVNNTTDGSNGYDTSDEEPANPLWFNYQSSTGNYTIVNGTFQLHQANYGYDFRMINYGSGSGTGDAYEFALNDAPTPTDYLTSGWYRIKVHKNAAHDAVTENQYAGHYLYNDEVWSRIKSDVAGFFPIRVQETASQPDDDDATYYIYINKDNSGNVQMRSSNGHYVGGYGLANYNTPLLQLYDYDGTCALENIVTIFDGNGYHFEVGTTSSNTQPLIVRATPFGTGGALEYEDSLGNSYTAATYVLGTDQNTVAAEVAERFLLRKIDLSAVGLTAYDVVSYPYPTYNLSGQANYSVTLNRAKEYQHSAPHVIVDNSDLASDVTDYYMGGTIFMKSSSSLATSDLSSEDLTEYWTNRHVKVVPGLTSRTVMMVDTYTDQVRDIARYALVGVGPGYPAEDHASRIQLSTINSSKNFSQAENDDSYTCDELQTMMEASEALFNETDIVLPPDGKAVAMTNAVVDGSYSAYSYYGTALLMNLTTLADDADVDNVTTPAESGWSIFVLGQNVTKESNTSDWVNTMLMNLHPTGGNSGMDNNALPLASLMIGRHIEDDRYAYVNVKGDYLAFDNGDMSSTYDPSVNYIRVRKLRVSDLVSNGTNVTNKQLYGKFYLTAYSTAAGAERVLTVKNDLNTTNYTLPMMTGYNQPMYDDVAEGSLSSAFEFAYVAEYTYPLYGNYLNENVSIRQASYATGEGENYYTTLYLPFPVTLPEGVSAYVIDGAGELDEETNTRTATQREITGILPARTAALIVLDYDNNDLLSNGKYTFVPALTDGELPEGMEAEDNWLHGNLINRTLAEVMEKEGITDYSSDPIYVFDGSKEEPGFYNALNLSTLRAGKIYLHPQADASPVRAFVLRWDDLFDDITTGVDAIGDGRDEAPIYDLNGRRIYNTRNLPHGIYIQNGKKIYR